MYKRQDQSLVQLEQVQKEADEMLQHMNHEKDEIGKGKSRLANLSIEDVLTTGPTTHPIQDSAVTYLSNPNECEPVESRLPEPPSAESSSSEQVHCPPMIITEPEEPKEEEQTGQKFSQSDWLKRMNQD